MTDPRSELDQIRQRAENATDGPWLFAYSSIQAPSKFPAWEALDVPEPHTGERRGECPGCPRRRLGCQHAWEFEDLDPVVAGVQASYGDTATGQRVKDAEFIAASRSDVPRLVAALTAVLDLHRPSTDHKPYYVAYCMGCWEAGGEDGAPSYPCPTVAAITDHLTNGDDR